jgi:ABC-type branched-subunit amino acid transport system ATPase component
VSSWFLRPLVMRREARWASRSAHRRVGLGDMAELPAARLTYGHRRLLESPAIAAGPSELLLDGRRPSHNSETEQLAGYLKDLRRRGCRCSS